MRMWMLRPEMLCKKHLLGEHGEIHKHYKMFERGISIRGRIFPVVLIEPAQMAMRHELLAEEMLRRGMRHQSPFEMPSLSAYSLEEIAAKADIFFNLKDLVERCPQCQQRCEAFLRNEKILDVELYRKYKKV